jgi:hypothetical protein
MNPLLMISLLLLPLWAQEVLTPTTSLNQNQSDSTPVKLENTISKTQPLKPVKTILPQNLWGLELGIGFQQFSGKQDKQALLTPVDGKLTGLEGSLDFIISKHLVGSIYLNSGIGYSYSHSKSDADSAHLSHIPYDANRTYYNVHSEYTWSELHIPLQLMYSYMEPNWSIQPALGFSFSYTKSAKLDWWADGKKINKPAYYENSYYSSNPIYTYGNTADYNASVQANLSGTWWVEADKGFTGGIQFKRTLLDILNDPNLSGSATTQTYEFKLGYSQKW